MTKMVVKYDQLKETKDRFFEGEHRYLELQLFTYKNKPFNGVSIDFHRNLGKKRKVQYRNGRIDGLWTSWYDNGKIQKEVSYKDGWKHGSFSEWLENGQLIRNGINKNGRPSFVEVWKPNGQKCLDTNLKEGSGLVIFYNEDGDEELRCTYKDGELVH